MCARFNRAPVIAGGNDDRVYAVHDAFVMCRGAIRIRCGKSISGNDPVTDLIPAVAFKRQFLEWDDTAYPCKAAICKIGKNTQVNFPAGNGFNFWSESFASSVDRVR